MSKVQFSITFDTTDKTFTVECVDTGETQTVAMPRKKAAKTIEEDNNPTPIVSLSESKLTFNKSAKELIGLVVGDKVVVAYDVNGNPVIGKAESFPGNTAGNKFTASSTVSFRGNANTELAKLGNEFILSFSSDGVFYLGEPKKNSCPEQLDENLQVPASEGVTDIPDINLDGLLDDIANNPDEYQMDAFDFNLD